MEDLVLESGIKRGISFSPGAVAEIKRLIALQPAPEQAVLRLGVKGGGCAGFTYIFDFDKPQANDITYCIGDITVVMDPMHQLYLEGTEIHFESGLNNRGFVYKNPNASKTCGCGESFG
jgi:iron-sulfur cluster assembly accessory protein